MEQCLGDQQFVTLLLYLDDICIFAPSIEEMLDDIELVFNRMKEFHLKIKPKKCHFFYTSVLFLGHVLSSEGISTNPKKVEMVWDWPIPTNTKKGHSFLGLASYYGGSFLNLQRLPTRSEERKTSCIIEITGPKEFKWTPEHEQVFDALKEALVTAPVLGYPDFNREFVLETNASLQGLGPVLSQQDETGKLCVIVYAS